MAGTIDFREAVQNNVISLYLTPWMNEIFELKTESEWQQAFPLLQTLRPNLNLETFLSRREELIQRDYHLFGLFVNGILVSVAGYVLQPHLERENEFWLHDFATLESERSKGYGLEILRHLEDRAKADGCSRLVLHTRTSREQAQNFYTNKAGYDEYALVYKAELE